MASLLPYTGDLAIPSAGTISLHCWRVLALLAPVQQGEVCKKNVHSRTSRYFLCRTVSELPAMAERAEGSIRLTRTSDHILAITRLLCQHAFCDRIGVHLQHVTIA
jgi:hypothetical protein